MSFNIALSGLNASNQELNTISNNIANVGTTGFKESRTEFSSVYNGNQAGGVQVASISQNFDKAGSITGTGRSLDLALTSSGFFVTQDSKGQVAYTRSGIFNLDSQGTVVSNTGAALQGYTVDANNNLQQGTIGDIQISTASLPAKATTGVDFVSNLDSRADIIDTTVAGYKCDPTDVNSYTNSYTTPVYDSLGNQHTVTQYFVKSGENAWGVYTSVNGSDPQPSHFLEFDESGKLQSEDNYNITFNPPGAAQMDIRMNVTGMSQYGSDFVVAKNSPDGYAAGDYADLRVEADGQVFATYSNGQSLLQGQVVLANFAAPQELMKTSDTAWTQTYGSGVPTYGTAGAGQFGELVSGATEGSNVDLTSELVNLMTAQRNYQANTKTISTADQLTQALFNVV
ncbi:MAG: flagellar hook protein FlgE [Vibrio sp.]